MRTTLRSMMLALGAALASSCTRPSSPAPAETAPPPGIAEDAEAPSARTLRIADDAPTPSAPAAPPSAAALFRCTARAELTSPRGEKISCYPYRCRAGACLRGCKAAEDCAGSQGPAELAAEGWPLECLGKGECVPMPPWKVNGGGP